MRRILLVLGGAVAALGFASLAVTLWLWFGDWPRETRELVDHYRSVAENAGEAAGPALQNAAARDPVSLGGTWRAVIDPYGRGEVLGLAPRAVEPGPSDLGEFSFADGLTLRVPGDWNTQDPRLLLYRGAVWYERRFRHRRTSGSRVFLQFEAAHHRAHVYLNGRLLGHHEGGFTPFAFEVSDRLSAGENLLVVRVDNDKAVDDVPGPVTDWLNYGGLTRDVLLVEVPALFVRSWRVGLSPGGGSVEVRVQLDGAGGPEDVTLLVPELGIEATAESDAAGRATFSFEAEPERWSPERPRLYAVEIRAGEDRVRDEVGFRTVSVQGTRILLNGEPVFLRGISAHDEAGGGAGRIHDAAGAARLLGAARELGCNFVRLAHYPHAEQTVRLADRLGLLLWAEIPVYWDLRFDSARTLGLAKRQLEELVARDRNRASVVIWSVGNETPQTPERLRFMTALVEHARRLDPTRLVSAALVTGTESLRPFFTGYYLPALLGVVRPEWEFRMEDPLLEAVDLAAVNQYFGWYDSGAVELLGPFAAGHARRTMLENLERIRFRIRGGRPLVVSEFGAGALAGRHAPLEEMVAYSEEYQAEVYRRQLAMLDRQPALAGMSPWVLKDFRSPLRLYQGVQDHWNRKGLLADDGTRKQAFFVLRDHYRERARDAASPG